MELMGSKPSPSERKIKHGPEERVKMTRLRLTIAKRLKEAQENAAMLTTFNEVDMSSIFDLRKKFKEKLDPRLYNGAILLGLNSPVIKSHGGTDYIGFSNSLDVCNRIIKGNLIDKIKDNIK